MARVVIVSNRVPIPKSRGPAAGGLAVALAESLKPGMLWFGWSGRIMPETTSKPTRIEAHGVQYATIDLSAADHRQFYSGFSNSVLWPLLHFRLELLRFRREDYAGYLSVNQAFADALRPLLEPDDVIWIHDYHLIPLGRMLRSAGVTNRIGFFLHIPFVPASVLEALPIARELLSDLCHYDVLGFQVEEHVQDFLDSAKRLLGARIAATTVSAGKRTVRVVANPIGIDPQGFSQMAVQAVRKADAKRLVESLSGRSLAIGVDRLDYSKGLPNRIEGIARFLSRYPEHLRRVSFLQITARSREDVDDYRRIRAELDRLAGNINGRFSDADWTPLRYGTRAVSRATLAGYYRMARIALVTPLRDGMNLIAKEYIAAQDANDPGVLILSRFAGAANELTDALLVNPYDPDEIADALNLALVMDASERRHRNRALRAKVCAITAKSYFDAFIGMLRDSRERQALASPSR